MRKAICTVALASLAVFSSPLAIAQTKRVEVKNLLDYPF